MITEPTPTSGERPAEDSSPVLLREIGLRNLLSFGPDTPNLPLQSLNILIGPNGSGKSNLIEAISLLRASAGDMQAVVRKGGGIREWIWKGASNKPATIEVVVSGKTNTSFVNWQSSLKHRIKFENLRQRFSISAENIEVLGLEGQGNVSLLYRSGGKLQVTVGNKVIEYVIDPFSDEEISAIAQFSDPITFPNFQYLQRKYETIRIYRDWTFGRSAVFRQPQQADERSDRLNEDFSNLGLFLNYLRGNPKAKRSILKHLRDIYDGVDDFDVSVIGGTVQVFFTEGDFTIPATRLSDGTLRYLCLLAILCDPNPPPLICIEEPELGLHPDILPGVANLLREASERTQPIVTTHSKMLVDSMTETPEAVLVCEKHKGQTEINRLDRDQLSSWLEQYELGQLWMQGEIGGTRW